MKDRVAGAQQQRKSHRNKTDPERNRAPESRRLGNPHGLLDVPHSDHAPDLGRVDDGDDSERKTAENGREDGLDQVVIDAPIGPHGE